MFRRYTPPTIKRDPDTGEYSYRGKYYDSYSGAKDAMEYEEYCLDRKAEQDAEDRLTEDTWAA